MTKICWRCLLYDGILVPVYDDCKYYSHRLYCHKKRKKKDRK